MSSVLVRSVDGWNDIVGQFRELHFDEFVFADPEPQEMAVFEHVVATEIPRLRSCMSRAAATSS